MEKTSAPQQKSLKRNRSTPFKSPFQANAASRLPQAEQMDVAELKQKLENVNKEIEELQSQGLKVEELQTHIDKLHEYNEIKDIGQVVLGRIANLEGVCTKDLYERYGLNLED